MRTTPKSNPVMACDYDDESGSAPAAGGSGNTSIGGGGASSLNQAMDLDVNERNTGADAEGGGKKKRKANNGKKRDEEDTSRATLIKRIRTFLTPYVKEKQTDESRRAGSADPSQVDVYRFRLDIFWW
jgi:hypothetical protein